MQHTFHLQHHLSPMVRHMAALALAAMSTLAGAAEIATDPGDYSALPPGRQLGILYYQHAERDAYYAGGNRVPGPFSLTTDIGIARLVHYTKLGDYVVDPQVVVPFGRVDLKTPFGPLAPTAARGVGDPIVGAALWLVNEAQRSFAVSAFVSVPVGGYNGARGPVNLGEHRWKGIFHAAYVRALSSDVTLDVIGETAVYGDNNDFLGLRKSQRAGYGAQTHLRYMLSAGSSVALSYFHDFGGATSLNSVRQNDRINNGRWQIGYAAFVSPSLQLQVQAGQGAGTGNGARESARLNLRMVQVY